MASKYKRERDIEGPEEGPIGEVDSQPLRYSHLLDEEINVMLKFVSEVQRSTGQMFNKCCIQAFVLNNILSREDGVHWLAFIKRAEEIVEMALHGVST